MGPPLNSRLIQVTNIAPSATKDHMRTLFGYIGRIDELKIFPPDESPLEVSSRVSYVRYDNASDASTACHLTNTVFIDRAIIIVPVEDGRIPDEATAMYQAAPPGTVAGVLPTSSTWPLTVVNQVIGTNNGQQIIMTRDPELTKRGLPPYPPLPATMDATKIDEIRRTVIVENLVPTTMPDQLMTYFTQVGEIKYVRMAGMASDSTRTALIEFSAQPSVPTALSYNGGLFNGRTIKVSHSTVAIIKPMPKMEVPNKEIEEAMKKVKEAQSLISGAVESEYRASSEGKRRAARSRERELRSRSRSRSQRKRRSGSRSRRDRSRDRRRRSGSRPKVNPKPVDRPRRRSRSPRRRSRTRSPPPPRRRSRSRSRRRSRSPRRRRSRSRSRRRRSRRSRTRSPRKRRSRSGSPVAKPPVVEKNGSVSPQKKSPSPKRRSSKSPKRSKRRSRTRSPRRRRSRSDSRGRKARKDRKRSRSRDRKKKDRSPDPDVKSDVKLDVKRDYDAEEKGFEAGEKKKIGPATPPDIKQEKMERPRSPLDAPSVAPPPPVGKVKKEDNLQQEDMEMDSSSD